MGPVSSVLGNVLRLAFKPGCSQPSSNILCVLAKNVYSAVVKKGDARRSTNVKTVALIVVKQIVSGAGSVSQWVDYLPSVYKALGWIPSTV